MRDIVFTLIVAGLLPVCFRRPLIGLLMFSWLAYMRTQDLTWGFARKQRWSFLVAGVTFLGFLAQPQPRLFQKDIRCFAMIALAIHVGISILLGDITTPTQFNKYLEYCKVIGVALFTTAVVLRREHLRVLMWVIALSFGFYGIKYGLAGVQLGFLRHPPVMHYYPALVESFEKRHGVAPPRYPTSKDITFLKSLAPDDELHRAWYQHRADFMTRFGRELRKALNDAGLSGVKVSVWVRPNHCLFDGVDLRVTHWEADA